MKAKDVFAAGIEYLKNHALELLKTRGHEVDDWDIQWVLTVPAIWSDAAKQFMREAAQRVYWGFDIKTIFYILSF